MTKYYVTSCKFPAFAAEACDKLRAYVLEHDYADCTLDVCCRGELPQFTEEDEFVCICNSCIARFRALYPNNKVTSVWVLADADPEFPLPDRSGESYTMQSCAIFGDPAFDAAVHSLLRKMNVSVVDYPTPALIEEHRDDEQTSRASTEPPSWPPRHNPHLSFSDKTPLHGFPHEMPPFPAAGRKPPAGNRRPPKDAAKNAAGKPPFGREPSPQEQAFMAEYAAGIESDQVLTYCTGCRGGITAMGKQPVDFVSLVMGVV